MRYCFVPDCNHNDMRDKCGFTKFPKTPDRKKRWISRISRGDRLPNKNAVVCNCHFEEGKRGVHLKKTPSVFRRLQGNHNVFPPSRKNARKRLMALEEPDIISVMDDTSASFSSGLLSASVSQSNISHEIPSVCDDLGTSALSDEVNASVQLDDTIDGCPNSFPAHSSTPNPGTCDVSGHSQALRSIDSTPTRKTSSNLRLGIDQSPSASHPSGWFIRGVRSGVPVRMKSRGSQTTVNTTNAATQYSVSKRGLEYVHTETQTPPIMFDNADHFVSFGDNLDVVKSLLGEVMEWRGKLIQAEVRINALSAEISSHKGEITASAQLIGRLTEESNLKDKEIEKLREQLKDSDARHATLLRSQMELNESLQEEKIRLLYRGISTIDARVAHFTGLPNVQVFDYLCSHFTMPLQYHYNWTVTALSREDQVFLSLMKLRRNFDNTDLAVWFNVSQTTVANVFLTILDALHQVIFLEALKTVPSRHKNKRSLPQCFKGFEDCRMIIDCTEVRTATPKSLAVKNIVYSKYKKAQTLKGLVGIAPNGAMTYASGLYPGSTSDKEIVQKCGILNVFERGDLVLADKGFTIRDLLQPLGTDLNIPPFLETPQFTHDQLTRTKVIARARIHVERAIQRIKEFTILDYVPITYWDISSKIFQVCAALTNFQTPLLREVEDKMKSFKIDWDDIENEFATTQYWVLQGEITPAKFVH